jgi:hypothetical protein
MTRTRRGDEPDGDRARGRWLLVAGAATGIALAAAGVVRAPAGEPSATNVADASPLLDPLPPDALARVNGRLILRRDFDQVARWTPSQARHRTLPWRSESSNG